MSADDPHPAPSAPCAHTRFAATRIAIVMAAVFFLLGIHLPYFPVWLAERGLSPVEVGVVLGLGPWMRVAAAPLLGKLADRSGRRRTITIILAVGVVVSYVALDRVDGFWTLLLVAAVLGVAFGPIIPLTDAAAVQQSAAGNLDYSRTRIWGSAAFIVAAVFGGRVLDGRGPDVILLTLIVAAIAVALVGGLLPPSQSFARQTVQLPSRRGALVVFFATCALLHASHAVLYGFGTTYWRDNGIDGETIGYLWGGGVAVEIVVLGFIAPLRKKLSPAALLGIAALGGLVRWSILASTLELVWLAAAAALHALTFAALHAGAMEFMRDHIPARAMATATGTYAAMIGIAFGIGLPAAGRLYAALAGDAFWAMTGVSALGGLGALVLATGLWDRLRR